MTFESAQEPMVDADSAETAQGSACKVVPSLGGKRLCYVAESPLLRRDYVRYGMGFFRQQGANITLVEVTAITNPKIAPRPEEHSEIEDLVEIRRPENLQQLGSVLSEIASRTTLIVWLVGFTGSPERWAVHRCLARIDTPYMVLAANAYPGFNKFRDEPRRLHLRTLHVLMRLLQGQIDIRRSLIARLPRRWLGVRPANYIVHGGRDSVFLGGNYIVGPSTTRIFAHAMDYDLYLAAMRDKIAVRDTAVFIDEHIGYHRDTQAVGSAPIMDPDVYYPLLRRVFDRIETKLGLEIVVAGNPRADYRTKPDLFGGRRIVMHSIASLIAEGRLVIGHRSTAIGLAVMFRRPVLLLSAKDFARHWGQWAPMRAFAEALGKQPQLIDDPEDLDLREVFAIDDSRYQSYRERFIKQPGTPEAPFWNLVLEALTTAGAFGGMAVTATSAAPVRSRHRAA